MASGLRSRGRVAGDFRDLRHTAASFLHRQGPDLKLIQATLRHTRLATTADIHTHVLDDVQEPARSAEGALLRELART